MHEHLKHNVTRKEWYFKDDIKLSNMTIWIVNCFLLQGSMDVWKGIHKFHDLISFLAENISKNL